MITAAPPLPLGIYARGADATAPFPLEEPGCRLFARARHGLWHAAHFLGLEPGDEVLQPAYHHGSEVEALYRMGLVCRFYGKGRLLEPDEGELASLLSSRTRALYLIHYLGFPQDVERWRRWCDERGLLLFEDVAQSWLATAAGRPLGSWGDAALFCLYKTCGMPDGAAVLLRDPPQDQWISANGARMRNGIGSTARSHASWLISRSALLARTERERRARDYSPDRDFALGDVDLPPSHATGYLLRRVADSRRIVARRRANYRHLLAELGGLASPPFDELPDEAVPYVFPIESRNKEDVLRRLEGAGIRAFNLWSAPHPSLPAADFPEAARRRERVIGLPVHQELEVTDLERITAALQGDAREGSGLRRAGLDLHTPLEREWDQLAQASRNIFATREWLVAWWRHYGRGELRFSQWRSPDGRLVAILPLYLTRRGGTRVLRFVGHGAANELGPICRPEDRVAAAQALRGDLARTRGDWDLFLGSLLPGEEPWAHLVGGHSLRRHPNPKVPVAERSWEEYLASLSTKFRKEIRYTESRLKRRHQVGFRTTEVPEQLDEDMDVFLKLHRARWDEDSSFLPRSAFYRDVARSLLDKGWLRLSFLELEGVPVAARFDFRYAGVHSAYNAGRDPSWHRESVGLVLRSLTMRQAFEEGVDEYRFLLGGESYKARFAPVDADLETIAVGSGARGRAAVTAARGLVKSRRGRRLLRALVSK